MGFLTQRERQVLVLLRDGHSVHDIGKRLKVSQTSISRSISNIRVKANGLVEDAKFLCEVGYMANGVDGVEILCPGGDPKALRKMK